MEKKIHLTEEQLKHIPKDVLITMYLQLTETMNKVAEQNNQLLLTSDACKLDDFHIRPISGTHLPQDASGNDEEQADSL